MNEFIQNKLAPSFQDVIDRLFKVENKISSFDLMVNNVNENIKNNLMHLHDHLSSRFAKSLNESQQRINAKIQDLKNQIFRIQDTHNLRAKNQQKDLLELIKKMEGITVASQLELRNVRLLQMDIRRQLSDKSANIEIRIGNVLQQTGRLKSLNEVVSTLPKKIEQICKRNLTKMSMTFAMPKPILQFSFQGEKYFLSEEGYLLDEQLLYVIDRGELVQFSGPLEDVKQQITTSLQQA